jgi:hypothetical protein
VALETTDNYCQRLRGFMLFYAAYMQVKPCMPPLPPITCPWCLGLKPQPLNSDP